MINTEMCQSYEVPVLVFTVAHSLLAIDSHLCSNQGLQQNERVRSRPRRLYQNNLSLRLTHSGIFSYEAIWEGLDAITPIRTAE